MDDWKKHNWAFPGVEKRLEALQNKKVKLHTLRPLPGQAVQKIRESLTLEWTYHSNSIEGNTLSLRETQMVIEDGFTVKGKSLREHFEAINHHEAIAFLEQIVSPDYILSAADVLEIHRLVMQKIEKEFAGRYRNAGVRIAGANVVPPNALKVYDLMEELIHWVNHEQPDLDPIVRAAIFHHRFVWIHPFFDGNGRTARLAYNLLLMKAGYPPAIILKNDRKKYYDALNKANNSDYSKLLLLVMQALERSLNIYISHLTNTYEAYRSIADIASDSEVPYGAEYLGLLARQGKIGAFKEGRNWLALKSAVLAYIRERERQR